MAYSIEVNGQKRTVDVDGDTPLLWVLRDELDLKGSKFGCGAGLCGACTVHLDGRAVRSCITPVSTVGRAAVATIEGMAAHPVGKRLQAAWMELDVPQMRLLSGRPARRRPNCCQPISERRRDRRRDDGKCLPLLHLHAHPRRDQARRCIHLARTVNIVSATPTTKSPSRAAGAAPFAVAPHVPAGAA
jgi:hypothetical protein